jgi:hypothetical protein
VENREPGQRRCAHARTEQSVRLRPVRGKERRPHQQGSVLHLLLAAGRVWAPSYFFVGSFDTYQLLINTPTTIITFLLVALLQNTQERSERAVQHKLDAIADGLADLMEHFSTDEPDRLAREDLAGDIEDLRAAVGLEDEM